MIEKPKKERRFLKTLGKIGEILLQEVLIKVGSNLIKRIGGKKNLPSILFLFLSISLFAQFPNTGNKQRLGFQTTADGLVWRGSLSDTASIQPVSNQNAWLIIDTVNLKIYSFDFTSNVWGLVGGGGSLTMPFDSITFNTAKDGTVGVGEVEYNDTQGSLIQGLGRGLVTNVIGQQLHQRVNNRTGATLAKGTAVYLSGSQGNRITVAKALAVTDAFSANTFGIVAENILNTQSGYVITEGLITNINTSALVEDSAVYLSPTVAGGLTSTKPQAPQHTVYIGVCVKSNAGSGELFVKIRNGQELDELHDVRITSPVNNASLYYKSSEGIWRDTTPTLLVSDTATMLTNYLRSGVASNIYLPLAGGTLTGDLVVNDTFKAKDFGNHTFVNYIQNGDFDLTSTIDASAFGYGYPNYIPLHWKSAATSRYVSTWSSTGGYSSPQHFKQYDSDASIGGALYQDVTNWQDLKGKTVTACGWFTKGTLTNSGNHAEIQINDGLTTTTTSIGTTTSWQRACVTKTISASATRVRVIVGCNLAVLSQGGAVSDMDAISLVIGEGKHEFSHKPLFDRDTQRLSGTLLIGYDSENNLAYNPSATSNLKVAGSTSLNGTLDVTGATTLTGGINGNTTFNNGNVNIGIITGSGIPTSSPKLITMDETFGNNTVGTNFKLKLFKDNFNNTYGFGISNGLLEIVSGNSGEIAFFTNGANERMRILSGGNVGIGTIAPNSKLDVRGSVIINEDSGDFDTRIESVGNANMVFVDASTDRVGIATNTPSKTLEVNGEVKIATVTATPTSLLGKDGSNVVGEVTDINQSGVMKVGGTIQNTSSLGIINVAHGLSYTPTKVIATIAQQSSYVIVCHGITSTNLNFTIYDSTNGTALDNVSVGFFWIAFK